MDVERSNLENADILAATGVSPATIQTWANRGILALAETQRNPGLGQKRLYSRLDVARVAVIKTLIERGLAASAAGQIAARLERSPQTAAGWRSAIEQTAGHIHLFTDGRDAIGIYVGNDSGELARLLTPTNEPTLAGVIGRGIRQLTQMQLSAAVVDVGPDVSSALREIAARRRYHLWFKSTPLEGNGDGQVKVQIDANPTAGSSGKHWHGTFAVDDLLNALAKTLGLSAPQLGSLRADFSSGQKIQLGGMTCALSVPEDALIELGMAENLSQR